VGLVEVHVRVSSVSLPPWGMASRVDRQVDEHLLHLPRVGTHRSQLRIERRRQSDVLADQPPQHPLGLGHQRVEVEQHRLKNLLATEGQQLPRQRRSGTPALLISRISSSDDSGGPAVARTISL
jgi:hypothetical protein